MDRGAPEDLMLHLGSHWMDRGAPEDLMRQLGVHWMDRGAPEDLLHHLRAHLMARGAAEDLMRHLGVHWMDVLGVCLKDPWQYPHTYGFQSQLSSLSVHLTHIPRVLCQYLYACNSSHVMK